MPLFRADWVAKNVVEMQNVLGTTSTQEVAKISGFDGLKFRVAALGLAWLVWLILKELFEC